LVGRGGRGGSVRKIIYALRGRGGGEREGKD